MLSQYCFSWLFVLFIALGSWICPVADLRAEPHVPAVCWPIHRDDTDEEEANVPDSPRPVVLMVKGKFKRPPGHPAPSKDEFDARQERFDLHVEAILFGPDPGRVVPFLATLYGIGQRVDQSAYYAFVCVEHGGKLYFDVDHYFFGRRSEPLEERHAFEAIAAARLDLLVLGSEAVFVGKPLGKPERLAAADPPQRFSATEKLEPIPPEIRGDDRYGSHLTPLKQDVQIEHVLYGDLKAGSTTTVMISKPLPIAGEGSCIYFVTSRQEKYVACSTSWDDRDLDRVKASLARREQHPVHDGQRQIQFLGNTAETIQLLASTSRVAQRLANERLKSLGDSALPAVARRIESNLFAAPIEAPGGFDGQLRLINLLSKMEGQSLDGEVVRLANLMLKRAEEGADFPVPPLAKEDDELESRLQRRVRLHYHLTAGNHSLAWLIQTLPPDDAAKLFCERLKKLRDLASYGWKDEAHALLETLHLEDRLSLPDILARSSKVKPVSWQGEHWPPARETAKPASPRGDLPPAPVPPVDPFGDPFGGPAPAGKVLPKPIRYDEEELESLAFGERGDELIARSQYGGELVWNVTTGKQLRSKPGELKERLFWSRDTAPTYAVAEDGSTWSMVPQEMPYRYAGERYGPPAAASIVVTPPGKEVEIERVFDDDKPVPGAIGKVRLFGYQEQPPLGLIPGGRYFYIGTNIFQRRDLKAVSFCNVQDRIDEMVVSKSGKRYALLTNPIVRVHDVESGNTLFAVKAREAAEAIAITPDGGRVAAISQTGRVYVWELSQGASP